MESQTVVAALAALAQTSRLEVFRLLIQAGDAGLAAGRISQLTGIPPSSLSFHLKELTHAGLTLARQEGRHVYYRANYAVMDQVVTFLVRNCCGGASCELAPSGATADNDTRLATNFQPQEPPTMANITIYHNPRCGTSRNTLTLIREAGHEPEVIEYLTSPPDRATLQRMIADAGLTVREALREKGTPWQELGLDQPDVTDDQLLDAMMQHPILINRPFVVTPRGTRLCRPSDTVKDILPQA